jgi:hypothetical protein
MLAPYFATFVPLLSFLTIATRKISALSANALCYSPNGALGPGNYPCFLGQAVSPCCGAGSICEASGLCKVPGSVGVSQLIRGLCTDSSWTSAQCPQYCLGKQFLSDIEIFLSVHHNRSERLTNYSLYRRDHRRDEPY